MTHAYLIKRNGKYHFRIRVPKELRSSIGTGEIHRSLGTSDNRLAQTLAGNLRAKVESEFAMLRHQRLLSLEHVVRPRPDDEVPRPPTRSTFATRATNERHQMPSTAIGQLIDEFAKDRQESWALKTKHMHLEVLRLFAGFVHNKPVAEINRQDCRDFKNTLAKLPPHWSRRYPGKSIDEIAELGRSPINPNTVNRRLIVITFFSIGHCWKSMLIPIQRSGSGSPQVEAQRRKGRLSARTTFASFLRKALYIKAVSPRREG